MDAEMQDLSDHYDRISTMPDSILIHILTFLKAREAVQTCLISKRWIDLWSYLPSLKFNHEEYENHMIFERFICFFLLFRKTSQLDTFQLRWGQENEVVDTKCVSSWVLYAVRCKPRVLSVYAHSYEHKGLPHSLFCCTSLVELKLFLDGWEFYDHIIPRSINLPFLRKLSLSLIDEGNFVDSLLRGCPLLEELELQSCSLIEIDISSSSLKHLSILECGCDNMILSCPNLINLHLVDLGLCEIALRNLFSLKNAYLHFPFGGMESFEILNGLLNATEIKLFGMGFKIILAKELPNCSTFKNLRHLVLDERLKSWNWDVMAYFVQHSPNLDKFYFSEVEEENDDEDNYSSDNEYEDAYVDED